MYYTDSKRDDSLRGFERYSQLLIPERLAEQFEQENFAKKAAASVAAAPKSDELEENLLKEESGLGSAPFLPASRDVEVFAPADVERLKARKMRTGSDYRTRLKETLPLLEKNGGRRLIVSAL